MKGHLDLFLGALVGAWVGATLIGQGADLRIETIEKQGSRSEITVAQQPGSYYILWRGHTAAHLSFAADLGLGSAATNTLADTNATGPAGFYRVEKVSMTAWRDTDGDGISDAWELLHRPAGAALNPADADEDLNSNGVPDHLDARRHALREAGIGSQPSLAAGTFHSLAIRRDGTLWGWGDNSSGQLASAAFRETNVPVRISEATNWIAVSAVQRTSYGLTADGRLWVWGNSSTGAISTPTQLGTNTDWIGLPQAVESDNPTALRADGTMWQFSGGFTNLHQLGTNEWAAVMDHNGAIHWAIRQDGTLWRNVTLFDTNPVWAAVSAGLYHVLALRVDGSLWAWTTFIAANGELGLGYSTNVPTRVGSATWSAVSAGQFFSVGIQTDGSLWWWGIDNGFTETPYARGYPAEGFPTRFGTNTDWIAVTAGDTHTLALRADGTLWTFGYNECGKLGNGTIPLLAAPTRIGIDGDWMACGVGTDNSFAVKSNGTLWAWGKNPYGALGTGDFEYRGVPRQVPGSNWTAVAGGGDRAGGLQRDGSLWDWGKFVDVFPNVWTNLPRQVGSDLDWARICVGHQHLLALKTNQTLWAWGRNVDGEVDGAGGVSYTLPRQVQGTGAWTDFSAGYYTSTGIRNGSLYGWGRRPGAGRYVLIQFIGSDYVAVANPITQSLSSGSHALALWFQRSLRGWGGSSSGQLGTNSSAFGPVSIASGTNWSQIAAGDLFTAARHADGSLWMMGHNFYGQLGIGTRSGTNLLTRIGEGTNWTSLAAGYHHVLALQSDGTLWAWGDNSQGQCGQGAEFAASPVAGTDWGRWR